MRTEAGTPDRVLLPVPDAPDAVVNLHATAVAFGGRGLLILGRAGSGKSSLALRLMALGAGLVADDQTMLRLDAGDVLLDAPPAIAGLIEARGMGLLEAAPTGPVPLALIVDLDQTETARLPPQRAAYVLGYPFRLLHAAPGPAFPEALLQALKGGVRPLA